MPDTPCPHCGQSNENEREVCWACCNLLKPQEAKPEEAPAARSEILGSLPGSIPVQPEGGSVRVTSSVKTAITVNGKKYARWEDVPEPRRSELMAGMANAFKAYQQGKKIMIVVNGKEYARWEEVPEQFRSALKDKIGRENPDLARLAEQGPKTSGLLPSIGLSFGFPRIPLTLDPNEPVATPDGFLFDDDGMERRISWRWISLRALGAIIFSALWFGILAATLYFWLESKGLPQWALDAIIVMAIGFPFAYVALAYLINSTSIRLDAARMFLRYGPLPWPGTRDVLKADIVQVFCEAYESNAEEDLARYRVKMLLKNGKTLKLVDELDTPEAALFIEQQIRRT